MKEEIQKFFKGDLEDSTEVLKTYSHDASLFEVRPKLVAYPVDSEDVKNCQMGPRRIKTNIKIREK